MKIYYGNGEVRLEGAVNIAAFEIKYNGNINAESEIPDSWIMLNNKNKIIGVSLGNYQPELLFTYEGEFRILSCRVTDKELNQKSVLPVVQDLGLWSSSNTKYEDFTQFPEDFDGTYVIGEIPKKTSIRQINLLTKDGEWFLEDGTPYSGEYHTHGDGQSMTGSKHTEESKNIFRKDNKGNLFKLENFKKHQSIIVKTRNSITGGY